ncbi:ABC transporter ATP-binding protein [Yersinia intermedia]|uniref:ABC transporter ATP-binding protein n=1 Tax=Yersinia intermedia TaxID=631 RepID=UPI000B73452F|nr:ABC transporter ATP-binding protein [Yersinia intermedia]MCW8114074.1 ABC transporter ATP-binding protein [Yersinia intermedia]MDA5518875.1 ABC transporter ATP-binding protein [Yersinia intermedia]OWF87273.1 ABC transporter ATP-binding protein [Yersinia intermedia]
MTQPVGIHLRQCSRTFASGHVALPSLDLDISPGETLVLLGPSGCGKTTMLRIISGLESPDPGGEVWFDDCNVTGLPIEKRNVGMVFQSYALFPNLDVAQNVAYGLKIHRLPEAQIRQRVAEMLEMVDLSALANRPIQALSGGQKQRVSLARAMAARPKVLLFDEPLAALDAKLRERLRVDIGQLLSTLGITAVYVTHDQQEAMALGDRVAVLERGRIAQIGTPRDIYHHPANAFVADFIGSVNCIQFHGSGERYCRPEDVHLCPPAQAGWVGRVIHNQFLGQNQRVLIDIGTKTPLLADCSTRDRWQTGQPVGIQIAPEAWFTVNSFHHEGGH